MNGATKLTFWAKGEKGGESAYFGIGTMESGDSCEVQTDLIVLTNKWQEYTIDLRDQDLSRIKAGFYLAIFNNENPKGCVLYLDDIDGIGLANVPYDCDSGSGVTDPDGAFYFYWGEACTFDLYGFDGYVFFSLHIDNVDAFGIGGIPFECASGWSGTTYNDGSFEYEFDDFCTFYF